MIKKKQGKISNISSTTESGRTLYDGPRYCVSEAGITQLTKNVAFELGPIWY